MGNWAITFKYEQPNSEILDNIEHVEFLDGVPKESVEPILKRLVRHGEYVKILKIENTRAHDKRILKQREYFKIPCSRYKDKFKCEWLMHGADCSCCEFVVMEADEGGKRS